MIFQIYFQEPDIIFGHMGGIPLSLPDEFKDDNYDTKPCPIIGEWVIVSVIPISRAKRKQLKCLGYTVIDLSEKPNFGKPDVEKMVARVLTGNYQHGVPNPNSVPL